MAVDNKTPLSSDLLRRLHSLHNQLAELESQLQRGPRQIKAGEAIVQEATQNLESARQDVKKATMACDEKQLQLKSREDRIEDLKSKLNTAASNKEFNLLKEQIAADQQANSVQSDEILEALERIDELHEAVSAAESDLKKKTKSNPSGHPRSKVGWKSCVPISKSSERNSKSRSRRFPSVSEATTAGSTKEWEPKRFHPSRRVAAVAAIRR